MSDIVLEVEESQPVEMSVAEQIVIGGGGDVGPATETEWGTVKVAEPIEGHPGYAKITHAKDGAVGTYDFYTPRLSSTSDTINEDLLPKADDSTYGLIMIAPDDGQSGGFVRLTYDGGDAVDVPIVGMVVSGDDYTETIRAKYLPTATNTTQGAVTVAERGEPGSLALRFGFVKNGNAITDDVPRLDSNGKISTGFLAGTDVASAGKVLTVNSYGVAQWMDLPIYNGGVS